MVRNKVGVGVVGLLVLGAVACGESASSPLAEGGGTNGDLAGNGSGGSAAGASSGGPFAQAGTASGGNAGASLGGSGGGEQGGGAGSEAGGTAGAPLAGSGGSAGSAGTAGGGGEGGGAIVDTTPPGALSLRADGSFNVATAFSCADVAGIEPGASVYYELKTDGATPSAPTPTSTKLGVDAKVCGINQNGATKLRILQYDAAGNAGPVTLHQYAHDTTAPVICSVSTSPDPVAFVDLPLHLRVAAERAGVATVEILGVGTATLKDDGSGGDSVAADGVYELDYTIPAGADVAGAMVTARFADAAGNVATPLVLPHKLAIDRTATKVSGAVLVDTVWTAAGSPYVITADMAFGADLVIDPGVSVIFKGGSLLTVRGELSAVGTQTKPIVMHDAWISLDGPKEFKTYDVGGVYVAGSRFDHVQMGDGELVLEETGFDAAGAYITNSEIGTLTGGEPFQNTFGVYVGRSHIRTIADQTVLEAGRIFDSFVDDASINGYALDGLALTYSYFGKLEVDRWYGSTILEHCDVGLLRLLRPTDSSSMFFHSNNLGILGAPQSLVVVSGAANAQPVNATGNYWGPVATAQMTQVGTAANIGAIFDFFDDAKLTRVDYSGFLTAPATAGPNWQLPSSTTPDDECEPGGGGSGGGGGTGGAGGASGAGGTSGMSGTAGNGGNGGTSSGQLLGGCDNAASKFCTEYTGPTTLKSMLQAECSQFQAAWLGSCADASLLGTCTYVHGSPMLGLTGVTHYYQGVAATVAQLKSSCETGLAGTWVTQ